MNYDLTGTVPKYCQKILSVNIGRASEGITTRLFEISVQQTSLQLYVLIGNHRAACALNADVMFKIPH